VAARLHALDRVGESARTLGAGERARARAFGDRLCLFRAGAVLMTHRAEAVERLGDRLELRRLLTGAGRERCAARRDAIARAGDVPRGGRDLTQRRRERIQRMVERGLDVEMATLVIARHSYGEIAGGHLP